MTNNYDIFISDKRNSQQAVNCWSCSNVVLLRSSFGVPLLLLWLSYGALKWIRSAFEENLKIMWRYTLLMAISALGHGTSIVASRARLCRFALQRTCVIEKRM